MKKELGLSPGTSKIDFGNNQKIIFFLHIPKAAGTTIDGVINRQYSKQYSPRVNGLNNIHCLADLPDSQRANIKLIRGHFAFGGHQFISCPADYFTLLRDPVKRVVSHYHYIYRSPSLPKHEIVRDMSLREFVLNDELNDANLQTRMLLGLSASKLSQQVSVLDAVKDNIENHFSVVGLVEKFDETLVLLRQAYKWSFPVYSRQNKTSKKQKKVEIDSDLIRIIEEKNSWDMELYEFASKRFQQSTCSFPGDFQKELSMLQTLNQVYQPLGVSYGFMRHLILKHILKTY